MSMQVIEHIEVGSGGAATIEFTSIPGTYTDLYVSLSVRSSHAAISDPMFLYPNGSTTGFTSRVLRGTGSAVNSFTATGNLWLAAISGANATSSTPASVNLYIPNYAGSQNKSMSSDGVSENNGTEAYQILVAHLWSNTAAITSLEFFPQNGSFQQYSSATLFGITSGSSGGVTVS